MSDAFVTGVATPICVFVLMFCVGFEVRREELLSLVMRPKVVVVGTLIQTFTAPFVAIVTVLLLEPAPEIAWAILVLSMSPGGALSNAYCYLAGLNVGLSIGLTTIGSLISILTLPFLGELLLGALNMLESRTVTFPLRAVLLQLAVLVLLPVVLGMSLRGALRGKGRDLSVLFGRIGFALLIAVIAMSLMAKSVDLVEVLLTSWLPAVVFTGTTMLASLALGQLFARQEAYVIAIEASVRNIPIALLISAQLLEEPMIGFFLGYLLVQFVMLLAVVYSLRSVQSAEA